MSIPAAATLSRKRKKHSGREEELGGRPVGAGVDLALEIVEIGCGAGKSGWHFGIGGDRNFERRDRLQAGDQLGGIGIAAGMRRELGARLGRIAAQRDDVAHAELPIIPGDRVDLVAVAPTQVRCAAAGVGSRGRSARPSSCVRSRVEPPAP